MSRNGCRNLGSGMELCDQTLGAEGLISAEPSLLYLSEPSASVDRCRFKDMSDGTFAVMLVAGGRKFWVVVVMFDLDILHPSEMESIAIDEVMEVTVATLPKGLGEYVKGVTAFFLDVLCCWLLVSWLSLARSSGSSC